MSKRKSIDIDGLAHPGQPMPNASRIGPMIASSGVFGIDLEGGGLLADLEGQSRALFANMVRICEAAGATLEHIIKVDVELSLDSDKDVFNVAWIEAFPDPASRPARHTVTHELPGPVKVRCEFLAFVG